MSLSLEDVKGEFREGYHRIEEVLTGMDAYITRLEKRIEVLEKQQLRVAVLTSRLDVFEAALYADESDSSLTQPKIFIG